MSIYCLSNQLFEPIPYSKTLGLYHWRIKDIDLSWMTFQEEDKLSNRSCSDMQMASVWLHFPTSPTLTHIPFLGKGEEAAFSPGSKLSFLEPLFQKNVIV